MKMRAVIHYPDDMQHSVWHCVPSGTLVNVEDIVRRHPGLRWRDVFCTLYAFQLEGNIIL